MSTGTSTRTANHTWLWALLPLLLAAMLAIPLLDVDAFNGDEPASLFAAGILRTGSWSILDVWENTAPRHPPGWSVLLSVWGLFVGWSELAIRALSLFIGLLTLAWVYRAGRDFFAPAAGLIAALLLSASVFHLAYMARAELYAPVALWTAMCFWFYWRVALYPQQPARGARRRACCWAAPACYIRTISARCCCLSSACFICYSSRSTGAGGVR